MPYLWQFTRMKQEEIRRPSKATQNEEDFWVDVHDDALMVELGIRCPNLALKDKSVWQRTSNERKMLKTLRHAYKRDMRTSVPSPKSIPVRAKLIIYLERNKRFKNTTYSTTCWQHEIGDVLSYYCIRDKNTGIVESVVSKYSYNGKTYSPKERPFWPGA